MPPRKPSVRPAQIVTLSPSLDAVICGPPTLRARRALYLVRGGSRSFWMSDSEVERLHEALGLPVGENAYRHEGE